MKAFKKIALYSGEIPSTTFVERLIVGLSEKEIQLLLFGKINKKPSYSKNCTVIGYCGKLSKLMFYFKYTLLLFFFDHKNKKKLDSLLQISKKNTAYHKIKFYPVLWHKPDVFHIQWAKSTIDWMWVQEFEIRLIVSLRGAHVNYSPIADLALAEAYRNSFPKVDGFHAVSRAIADEACKYGATSEKITVVYSGLEIGDFSNSGLISNRNKNKPFRILSVGRAHWVKGYSFALDACQILKEHNFDFEYQIIGAANYEELVYQRSDLALEKEVSLTENISFQKVKELMMSADLLLLPSVEEGIANVVLEAMALGTLVLSTNCGGMEEVIVEGKNGFLVPIRNANAMAAKIMQIEKLEESRSALIIENAKQTLAKQHTNAQMIKNMETLYAKVLR